MPVLLRFWFMNRSNVAPEPYKNLQHCAFIPDRCPPRRAALVDLLDCQPLHTSKATAAATIRTAANIQYWTLNAKDAESLNEDMHSDARERNGLA
jgi:hypothetical protein